MAKTTDQAALQEFFRWERQSWVEVVGDITTDERAYFMPVETLRSYFTGNGSRKLNKILCEVFQSENSPVDPEVILRGHTAVFCILLRISKGKHIEDFAYFEELSDQRLPFDPAHPPAHFPEDVDHPDFLQRFCEVQWMYCVPVFDSHMLHKHFGRQRLLPITQKENYKGSREVSRCKIKLYGPHNKLTLVGSDTQINNTDPNTFMLKKYISRDAYRREVKNFSNAKHSESIIRFHGSYTHGNDYNILLEFADKGSLEEYFQTQTPPSRGEDIVRFWGNLFQLIKALKAIHSFLGGHQNVQPSSVLVLSYGTASAFNWQFKLADFGKESSTAIGASEGDQAANDSFRSQTYVAPECHTSYSEDGQTRKRSSKSTQAADVWSLGCIYSEAAVWIADGYSGVIDYRRQRMAEIEKLPEFRGEDGFHDGERVLKAVVNAHGEIELRLRRSDNITKDVLDSMVEEMLWEEDRPGAKALWRRAEGILSRARQKQSSGTNEATSSNRPTSNHTNRSRTFPVLSQSPPHPPPERPLPERPRGSTSRSSSTQRQSPANVEMWRTLVRVPSRDLASSVYGGEARTNPESISEHDTDVASSISGWQGQGGNRESLASPITSTSSSPHTSTHFDFPRPGLPAEGLRRGLSSQNQNLSQRSSSLHRPGRRGPYKQSPMNGSTSVKIPDDATELTQPSTAQLYAQYLQDGVTASLTEANEPHGEPHSSAIIEPLRVKDRDIQPAVTGTTYATPSLSNPTLQSNFPQVEVVVDNIFQQNTSKRIPGFSLFPNNANKILPPAPILDTPSHSDVSNHLGQPLSRRETSRNDLVVDTPTTQYSTSQSADSSFGNASSFQSPPLTRSDSISTHSVSTVPTSQYGSYETLGHLSLGAVLDWKKAHKKSKKNARVPPVRGADLLDKCNNRDHVFILDDGVAMREQWPQAKKAFEALSYILKPMAPDGIDLYFTNSYDTWRRHNTSELVDILEKKELEGGQDFSYRLGLQLKDYVFKANNMLKLPPKKAKKVRPTSFYILSNGNWKSSSDPTAAIRDIADHLIKAGMSRGHLTIQFVSFGQNAPALQQINDIANTDFGLDLVDTTPSTDDVLKMLCGPLDKGYFQGFSNTSRAASSASTMILPLTPLTTLPPIELA